MSTKLTSLTPEQEARLPEITKEYIGYGTSTAPIDREVVTKYIHMAYDAAKLEHPKFIEWLRSPMEGMKRANELLGKKNEYISPFFAYHEASWLAFYATMQEFGIEETHALDGLIGLVKSSGWVWFFDEAAIVTERPVQLSLDAEGRLHNETDMAIKWSDDWGFCVWHGVTVPDDVILRPETITAKAIDDERNAEVRRVMVTKFGMDRYLVEGNAKEVNTDETGTLYRKEVEGDEPIQMVKVKNSSPEPDGTYKDYFLPVPPDVRTAKEGVAWTFGLTAEEYNPEMQT